MWCWPPFLEATIPTLDALHEGDTVADKIDSVVQNLGSQVALEEKHSMAQALDEFTGPKRRKTQRNPLCPETLMATLPAKKACPFPNPSQAQKHALLMSKQQTRPYYGNITPLPPRVRKIC